MITYEQKATEQAKRISRRQTFGFRIYYMLYNIGEN